MNLAIVLLFCFAVGLIDGQNDCTGKPDGPCCAGCHSYTLCQGGVGTLVYCPLPDYAYNELIQGCDLMVNTPPPCGNNNDCSKLPDAKYPDMTPGQECEYFYTCKTGVNLGNTPCNAPDTSGLVFDYYLQLCNWKQMVRPPCGTYNGTLSYESQR